MRCGPALLGSGCGCIFDVYTLRNSYDCEPIERSDDTPPPAEQDQPTVDTSDAMQVRSLEEEYQQSLRASLQSLGRLMQQRRKRQR